MRLSIFARLVIGYLVLFSMLAGVSLYFIYHLGQYNKITRSIILNDTSILEYSNQLTDTLLSEVRSERKYVVLKDETLYENYLQGRDEFNQILQKALARANSEEMKQFFYTISVQHEKFSRMVKSEREEIRSAKPYMSEAYATEKKEISDDIIDQLKKTRQASEKNTFTKIIYSLKLSI
jgi:CHASE3 domain sensor protein